jgi:hypothetical protein
VKVVDGQVTSVHHMLAMAVVDGRQPANCLGTYEIVWGAAGDAGCSKVAEDVAVGATR